MPSASIDTVSIPFSEEKLEGTLRIPHGRATPGPAVLLVHGLGGTRAMGLDRFAGRFTDAGLVTLTVDYRYFGGSSGQPRALLDIPSQRQDIRAALAWLRRHAAVDATRVGLWGTSFGGGHAIAIAAEDPQLAAVVAQCPFTDGLASSFTVGPRSTAKLAVRGLADVAAAARGKEPTRVALAGRRGDAALMTAPDALPGYEALASEADGDVVREVPGRIGLLIGLDRPGKRLPDVQVPLQLIVCRPDTVAPAKATLRHAERAKNPNVTVEVVDHGHFAIYDGDPFEEVVALQTAFLVEHLAPAAGTPA